MLTDRDILHVVLQRRLRKAQEAMKLTANKHRQDVQFSLGDWVYVKLRPHCQTFVAQAHTKLSKRYFGPFQVAERIRPVAYKLHLLASSRIHPVFHVSLLKPHLGPVLETPARLPPSTADDHPLLVPLSFLNWNWDTSVSPLDKLVLVQWEDNTREATPDNIPEENNINRPRRTIKKPNYLKDYA
ncbi:uncharacterized protein [Glycine max]|uniref:uncharacterized protein n=1 Tax=Glycine max TaxID=3847 RepID=UPI000E21BEA1|nr:uncharacterized protein LOC113001254 [Glycine max]|eukprot:XP_025983852.1 uncharacterized protein LOC113001254 [Glycine max]